MTRIRWWLVFELLLVSRLWGASSSVLAQEAAADSREEARSYFRAGIEAFAAGRLEQACPALQRARDLVTTPVTAWNASLCWERAGELSLARAALDGLTTAPPGEDLVRRLGALEAARASTPAAAPSHAAREPEVLPPDRAQPGHAQPTRVDGRSTVSLSERVASPDSSASAATPADESMARDDTAIHWLLAAAITLAGGALAVTLVSSTAPPMEPASLRIATLTF